MIINAPGPEIEIPVLTAKNICKHFGRNSVLKGINLELDKGKLYGITGENGSGKTTLLNIFAGFWRASDGLVRISGTIGFCPQEPYLFSDLTAGENIDLFSYAFRPEGEKFREHRKMLLKSFNFSGFENTVSSKLSTGTIHKLNLIISLLNDPDLLLFDEPYTALDWDTYQKFWDYSLKLKDAGKTILIVSHLIYDKSKMDKIWNLNNGTLVCG
jgi:ABC-2 type transport system ATP-binding protein